MNKTEESEQISLFRINSNKKTSRRSKERDRIRAATGSQLVIRSSRRT
jgi:hypothetical protein